MECGTCTTGIDHCHGTLISHPDGRTDCTDHGCADLDPARHRLTIDCESISGGCGCVEPPHVELRAS